MRILFDGEEYQISGLNSGFNLYGTPKAVIVGGVPVAMNGVLCEGVEDITVYDADGVEIDPNAPPVLPTIDDLKADIQAFMDEQGIEYNSSDTKADLIQKIEWFYSG
jgi:hypothetical protein